MVRVLASSGNILRSSPQIPKTKVTLKFSFLASFVSLMGDTSGESTSATYGELGIVFAPPPILTRATIARQLLYTRVGGTAIASSDTPNRVTLTPPTLPPESPSLISNSPVTASKGFAIFVPRFALTVQCLYLLNIVKYHHILLNPS